MGNSSSTRRVTVLNDDTVGIVQVSESVVKRLKGEHEKEVKTEYVQPEAPAPQVVIEKEAPKCPSYPPETFSSTLEQRQKYHDEFTKAKASWQKRINELHKQNKELFETTRNKFSSQLTEVEDKYINRSFAPVCPDKEDEVRKCYQENLKTPLNCSKEVKDFVQCIDRVRMDAITSRG